MKLDAIFPMMLVLIIAIGLLAGCKSPAYEWERTLYFVKHQDTLWNICQQYCPSKMDIEEYIYLIKLENNMASSTIHAGDTLILLKEVKTK